jgi:lysozyme
MRTSDLGMQFIMKHEGVRCVIYDDATGKDWAGGEAKGYLTIGVGHLIPQGELHLFEDRILHEDEIYDLLKSDLKRIEKAISRCVFVDLTQEQFDTLVSFTFNVGVGNLQASTLLRRLNVGGYSEVPTQLARWNRSKGKVVTGLINRRAAEAALWASGEYGLH